MNASPDKDDWPWYGTYLYRADGRHTGAVWAKTRGEFVEMLPKIVEHVNQRREVAITGTGVEMLFHAKGGKIEWDGIGLEPLLRHWGLVIA